MPPMSAECAAYATAEKAKRDARSARIAPAVIEAIYGPPFWRLWIGHHLSRAALWIRWRLFYSEPISVQRRNGWMVKKS